MLCPPQPKRSLTGNDHALVTLGLHQVPEGIISESVDVWLDLVEVFVPIAFHVFSAVEVTQIPSKGVHGNYLFSDIGVNLLLFKPQLEIFDEFVLIDFVSIHHDKVREALTLNDIHGGGSKCWF